MRRKISFIALLFLGFALSQCNNDIENPDQVQLKKDQELIDKYIADNNLQGINLVNGLFKSTIREGYGDTVAKQDDGMVLGYKLRLLDGTLIDSAITFYQHGQRFFPVGFEVAIGTLKEGEISNFIFSSIHAFRNEEAKGKFGTVPPNSVISMENMMIDIMPKREIVDKFAIYKNLSGKKTSSGVFYSITQTGVGDTAKAGQTLTVKYNGYLLNGASFDDGNSFQFVLGAKKVIQGWEDAFAHLKKGDKATIIIPSELAYGITGQIDNVKGGYAIPPNAVIAFDVEVLNIQ